MKELATLPSSIRQRLELAQSLMNEDRPQEARTVLAQAAVELAKVAPELSTLVQAAAYGAKGIAGRIRERHTTMERVETRIFGLLVNEEWIPIESVRDREFELYIRW